MLDIILKIKDLPDGRIIWYKGNILGITGSTLPKKYYKYLCKKIIGNFFDYELLTFVNAEKL